MNLWPRPIKSLSDERLMEMISHGQTHAFDELYDRYAKRLHFFFLKMLNYNQAEADDFLQELFLKIIERPQQFSTEKKFKPWIYTVAFNMCKNEYRKRTAYKWEDTEAIDQALLGIEPAHESLDKNLLSKELQIRLSGLEEAQRMVLMLRYYEELSVKEIAEILDIAEGTVKSRLFYGLQKMATKLQAFNPKLS